MATVNKILLPRRGKKSVMLSPSKAAIVLEKGELFVESSDEGIGKGHARIKIGNGSDPYSTLDYAIGDTSNDEIEFSESAETDIDVVIEGIATKSKLRILITNIKRSIILLKDKIDTINALLTALTASDTIRKVEVVTELPPDAAAHMDTLYLIKQS